MYEQIYIYFQVYPALQIPTTIEITSKVTWLNGEVREHDPNDLVALLNELYENAMVFSWNEEYRGDMIGGEGWTLDVIYGQDRMRSHGINAYPGTPPTMSVNRAGESPLYCSFIRALNSFADRGLFYPHIIL